MPYNVLESSGIDVANIVYTRLAKLYFPLDPSWVDPIKSFGDTWADKVLSAAGGGFLSSVFGLLGPSEAQRKQMASIQNARSLLDQQGNDGGLVQALDRVITESHALMETISVGDQNAINQDMWERFQGLPLFEEGSDQVPSILTETPKATLVQEIGDDLGISAAAVGSVAKKTGNAIGDAAKNTWDATKEIAGKVKDEAESILGTTETVVLVAAGLAVVIVGALLYAIIKNPGRVKESAQAATAVKGVFK